MTPWLPLTEYPATRDQFDEGPKVLVWQLPDGLELSGVSSNPTIGFIRCDGWLSIESVYDEGDERNIPLVPWRWMPLPKGPPRKL
jgi:hypothetical protein